MKKNHRRKLKAIVVWAVEWDYATFLPRLSIVHYNHRAAAQSLLNSGTTPGRLVKLVEQRPRKRARRRS